MNKLVVIVFESEEAAYKGQNALKELTIDGDISLYSEAVIAKDASGQVQVKQAADEGAIGTWVGFFTGSLTGMLAGPVGMAVGASLGTMTGMFFDLDKSGVDITFVDDVASVLSPGKAAILADIDETWEVPLDTKMDEANGMVFRRLRYEVVEDQMERESAAYQAELDDLERERKEASEEHKAKFQAQIDKVKEKLAALQKACSEKLQQVKANADAKIAAIEADMKDASDRKKSKLDKRKSETQADLSRRSKKLEQAGSRINDALSA